MKSLVSFSDAHTGQSVWINPDNVIALIPDRKLTRVILSDSTEILTTRKVDEIVKLINDNASR